MICGGTLSPLDVSIRYQLSINCNIQKGWSGLLPIIYTGHSNTLCFLEHPAVRQCGTVSLIGDLQTFGRQHSVSQTTYVITSTSKHHTLGWNDRTCSLMHNKVSCQFIQVSVSVLDTWTFSTCSHKMNPLQWKYAQTSQCLGVTNEGVKQLACIAASEAQLKLLLQVLHQMSTKMS